MYKDVRLEIKDTIFDPNLKGNKVHAQAIGSDRPMYKVWLHLEGEDLPFVKSVRYTLHPTFSDPIKTVYRSPYNSKCTLILWTWGTFTVKARVELMGGENYDLKHLLQYGKQITDEEWEYAPFVGKS